MAVLMKYLRNWTNMVSIIGIILVFAIVLSGVDAMYILVVLGAMNLLYGLYSVVTKKSAMKGRQLVNLKNPEQYHRYMGVCQMVMGVFVLGMGIIYINKIVTAKYFWDIVLVGIVILMIFWYTLKIRSRR